MDGHMFDDLPKIILAVVVIAAVIGIAIGAVIVWLVMR